MTFTYSLPASVSELLSLFGDFFSSDQLRRLEALGLSIEQTADQVWADLLACGRNAGQIFHDRQLI